LRRATAKNRGKSCEVARFIRKFFTPVGAHLRLARWLLMVIAEQ